MDATLKFLKTSKEARFFAEKYVSPIISILVEQQPAKIGTHERNCVTDSLSLAVNIVALDLEIQIERQKVSVLIDTLQLAFDKRKQFYRGNKQSQQAWNVNHMQGLPEARIRTIERFRTRRGFQLLNRYILQKIGTTDFPKLDTVHQLLVAACDVMISSMETGGGGGGSPGRNIHQQRGSGVGAHPAGPAPVLPPPGMATSGPGIGVVGGGGGDNRQQGSGSNAAAAGSSGAAPSHVDDAILVANAVMKYLGSANEESLKKIPAQTIKRLREDLAQIFDRLIETRRESTMEFYAFRRSLALKLITSQSLPLKLFGWEEVGFLIDASARQRPPPRAFMVTGAGCTFVNGMYEYIGPVTADGYARHGVEITYVRKIPDDEQPGGGKKLTLFRCTMRSAQKWWFLSEADEEQPGTDRDIDYYQHKSKEHEEGLPPPEGWFTCRNAGIDPPPRLSPQGVVVPPGQEYETLDHQLAKWAIENEIVEQVLGDTTIHREVVARSTGLIKFLAEMCERYPPLPPASSTSTSATEEMRDAEEAPDDEVAMTRRYCLQAHHLLFAWKTCLRKADAAVSSQVYFLLVSILPLCPTDLAIPLLKAVQTSLRESQEKRNYLMEVSEFCSALAQNSPIDNKSGATPALKEAVREEALNLLWSVLTHRDASTLRSYDTLKRYVTLELRVEPKGREHRDKFMKSCIEALAQNTKPENTQVDEVQALRMVKLTHFVLDACPRDQADRIVTDNAAALPNLLFAELTAYLTRRKNGGANYSGFAGGVRTKPVVTPSSSSLQGLNSNSSSADSDSKQHGVALGERLRIFRHVYGLSDPQAGPNDGAIMMTYQMLETLWGLCDAPDDRSALMSFIAGASISGKVSQYDQVATANHPATAQQTAPHSEQILSAAFSEDVCRSVFLNLFCSKTFAYDLLGERAYRSFQWLFNAARQSPFYNAEMKETALDALWRICLTVVDDAVASQAMKDLLNVYIKSTGAAKENGTLPQQQPNVTVQMVTDEKDTDSFGERMFKCLTRVKQDLDAGADSAGRSAERCLRILNAAIGQNKSDFHSLTSSSIIRLSTLGLNADLGAVQKCLPHGMRGQSSYRRVSVSARRHQISQQNQAAPASGVKSQNLYRFPLDLHPLETLASVKMKVAQACQCSITSVKPIQVNGRGQAAAIRTATGESPNALNLMPEDSVVDENGIVEGCEIVFVIADRPTQNSSSLHAKAAREAHSNENLSAAFFGDDGKLSDRLFSMLLRILKSLPWKQSDDMTDTDDSLSLHTHKLVWDFLLAMPTNSSIASRVKSAQSLVVSDEPSVTSEEDAMEVEASAAETWNQLLDVRNFDRSVYVLLTIDAFLRPAPEVLSLLPLHQRELLQRQMEEDSQAFRRSFIVAGGFGAVVRFFSASEESESAKRGRTRRGNAVALRILKACLFGNAAAHSPQNDTGDEASVAPDEIGGRLLQSLSDAEGLLKSLTSMVVDDPGISSSTISDVLRFLRLLFQSQPAAQSFVSLPAGLPERFLIIPLLHDEPENARSASSINATMHVRRSAHDLILQTPALADQALPWLIKAIDKIDVASESTTEYFDVLEKLVSDDHATARSGEVSESELRELGTMVCKKLASCPRPASESDAIDHSTGVLCGCLKILRAIIEKRGCKVLLPGTNMLLQETGVARWSASKAPSRTSLFDVVSSTLGGTPSNSDSVLIDLIGAIFDGFLSPIGSSTVAICCDRESRRTGFEVVGAAARFCEGGEGYMALVERVGSLISSASPNLRNRWDQFGGGSNEPSSRTKGSSKYSGLRNQGCTCYMNSVLQQLFMMPELRDSMCSAPLPITLRSSGGMSSKGSELEGKKISLQWENGVSYDAEVLKFSPESGTHTIRYLPIQVATVGGITHHQMDPEEINRLPPHLLDEFVLSEGRPGKETGVYELVKDSTIMATDANSAEDGGGSSASSGKIQETEDEAASRHLLEEVQRTFVHLLEGSRGRFFDPRVLVEACACLKLEFDVWQQNDASEFTTKFLDRLEISLKKYAPDHFRYMDHTFGLKQTKQKICKECGLKTNREEKLLNIDCQIRGKTDIHEALAAMTEVEIMEGSNKVFCDRCKKNTDTILRTAISTLPNMLILSLKRFDLDFNTFETVKLNSRCAFGDTLNMKEYTLEGLDSMENSHQAEQINDPAPMETDDDVQENDKHEERLNKLPDDDYEYRLKGVLVHAGVAQGGHYYSFIKDRNPGSGEEKWYRFDDEDVTPFDPASIESECFGGKVKKETKWPNGQIHTVEQEQFANALMLFYEKVKQSDLPPVSEETSPKERVEELDVTNSSSGYDVFKADVRRSNAAHRFQSFLFDSEFQDFLKGLLELCQKSGTQHIDSMADSSDGKWQQAVLQMLLAFVFDVSMYSLDRSFLGDWTKMLEEALLRDRVTGRKFVHDLAKRSREVSTNWLRTYLLECPDQDSRAASVRIFSAAVKSCLSWSDECVALGRWCQEWEDHLKMILNHETVPAPCTLGNSQYEDISKLDGGGASSVGVMISFLNVLLEAMPRCSRYSAEVFSFVRELVTLHPDGPDCPNFDLRYAMIEAMIPPRLIALAARDQLLPVHFRYVFPGASVSVEVANTQARTESNHAAHAMPMTANHVMHASEINNPRNPTGSDYVTLLEALVCIAGLPCAAHKTLLKDSGEMSRNRRRLSFTDDVVQALTTLYQESCAPGAPGMGQREIQMYLEDTGVDSAHVTPQKIMELLAKYPTNPPGGAGMPTYLSLNGFLAYYRDAVQSHELKLRHDLSLFGFRPDLSRRSDTSRFRYHGERKRLCGIAESVAIDVAELLGDRKEASLGFIADKCLSQTYQLYAIAFSVSEPLALYLVAAAASKKDSVVDLIDRILAAVADTTPDWSSTDTVNHAAMALQVIASLPGPDQNARISRIMLSDLKSERLKQPVGMLHVLRYLHHARQQNHYSNEIHWNMSRYVDAIKFLRKSSGVYNWMNENAAEWAFSQREITDNRAAVTQQTHHIRGDYGTRDGVSIPIDHHTHSDSDLQGDMNDSDEDEDSQYGDVIDSNLEGGSSANEGPFQVIVANAGQTAVNGTYHQDGYFQEACRYAKDGRFDGKNQRFYIFQCNVSNNTKHWYISIVPIGSNPGTSSDIDFYSAPVTDACGVYPPRNGWVKAPVGKEPSPSLDYRQKPEDDTNGPEGIWNGTIDDDENPDGPGGGHYVTRMT